MIKGRIVFFCRHYFDSDVANFTKDLLYEMTNIHSFESHERARFNKFRFRVCDQPKTVCPIEITCLKDLTDFENYKGKNCYYHLIKFKYEERVLYDDRINSVSCFFDVSIFEIIRIFELRS